MKRERRPPRSPPKTDAAPFEPVYDKPPELRTPREIKEAIETDAVLERRGEHSR
jgi:hypothetical protein